MILHGQGDTVKVSGTGVPAEDGMREPTSRVGMPVGCGSRGLNISASGGIQSEDCRLSTNSERVNTHEVFTYVVIRGYATGGSCRCHRR